MSLAQIGGATVIERFALGTGRLLGVLARVPANMANAYPVLGAEPHLTTAGSYVITVAHSVTCKPVLSSECIPVGPNTCGSRIESLNPTTRRWTTLFTERPNKLVFDAIPGPDGRAFALLEQGCSTATITVVVRAQPSGREFTLGTYNPGCFGAPTAGWSSGGAQLLFVDAVGPQPADGVVDCSLAIVSSRVPSSNFPYRFVAPDAGCSFHSATFDTEGIAAIEVCGPGLTFETGDTTRLLQLNHHRQVVTQINLPRAQPAIGNDGQATLVYDPQARTVLVSQNLPGHPPVTRIWTFDGAHLHLIRRFINRPLVAEP